MDRIPYKIHSIFDTETCNIGSGADTRAYAILYIFADISACGIESYTPGCDGESVHLIRRQPEAMEYIERVIGDGLEGGYIPIICAYNLMFDLQTILYDLNSNYELQVCAQSASNIYTMSVMADGNEVCRFWDTFHLEMGGLAAMGATCGLEKAVGDWDYTIIRTPETPLTDAEKGYAVRDVQVIPAYLRYILEANPHISECDLGVSVITKTSIVRSMAKAEIGPLRIKTRRRTDMSLLNAFERTCKQEQAPSYEVYCLRKACFRGGFTFTAANWANRPHRNSASLDAVSMHHLFINGRYIPVHFSKMPPGALQVLADNVVKMNLTSVLARYHRPFDCAFHARIRFTNLRLKSGSVFERCAIGCIAEGKFKEAQGAAEYGDDPAARYAERSVRDGGWVDRASRPVFAFSKLMAADEAVLHLTEVELYTVSLVYEWDSMEVVLGEATLKFAKPPDYVSLQSNILYRQKSAMKDAIGIYREGMGVDGELPCDLPEHIAQAMEAGEAAESFLNSFYNSTVKGKYNGIYGTQAQDVLKPGYRVDGGIISVDSETKVTADNYLDSLPKRNRVLYTYGMRIVGGSRLHLAIAIYMLDCALGERIDVTGGDTDSMKVRCDGDVSDADLIDALKPLADAADRAMESGQSRIRADFSDLAAGFDSVGHFEVEKCGDGKRWDWHMEGWNKARVSMSEGSYHVTCAGLSRPPGAYTVEDALGDLGADMGFSDAAKAVLGYNCEVGPDICHSLQKHTPLPSERYCGDVTDYRGVTCTVDTPQAVALYPASRILGDTSKRCNMENVDYMRKNGIDVDTSIRMLYMGDDGKARLECLGDGIL